MKNFLVLNHFVRNNLKILVLHSSVVLFLPLGKAETKSFLLFLQGFIEPLCKKRI